MLGWVWLNLFQIQWSSVILSAKSKGKVGFWHPLNVFYSRKQGVPLVLQWFKSCCALGSTTWNLSSHHSRKTRCFISIAFTHTTDDNWLVDLLFLPLLSSIKCSQYNWGHSGRDWTENYPPIGLTEDWSSKKSISMKSNAITAVKLGHLLSCEVNIFDYETLQGPCMPGEMSGLENEKKQESSELVWSWII